MSSGSGQWPSSQLPKWKQACAKGRGILSGPFALLNRPQSADNKQEKSVCIKDFHQVTDRDEVHGTIRIDVIPASISTETEMGPSLYLCLGKPRVLLYFGWSRFWLINGRLNQDLEMAPLGATQNKFLTYNTIFYFKFDGAACGELSFYN